MAFIRTSQCALKTHIAIYLLLELTKIMPVANFSRIVIIQSLFSGDEFTGTKLHEDLETLNSFHDLGLEVDLINIERKDELFGALKGIREKTKDGSYPLLHLEIHGSNDTSGLILSSRDYVGWSELKGPLTEINIACRLNLIVILAVCYGAHLMQIIQPVDRAPCWGLIGPTEEIKCGLILKSFYEFYKVLIETGSGAEAFKILAKLRDNEGFKGAYRFSNAEYFFKTVYLRYKEEECSPSSISKRAKRMYRKMKKEKGNSLRSVGQIKRDLRRTQEEYFYKYSENFFMCDLFEENKSRFNVKYKEVVEGKTSNNTP